MDIFLKTTFALAAFAALAVGTALPASAQTSTFSVFGTGVDASGAVLPDGTAGDPHYTLVQNPLGTSSQIQVVTAARGFPVVPNGWIVGGSASAWIAPSNDPFIGPKPAGLYDYRTTFDLAGFNPATASLSGQWAVDNFGTILLNGTDTGNQWHEFDSYGTFAIGSGFQSGVNTLDFLAVDDGQGVAGLRVDGITGSAALSGGGLTGSANPVPEASTTVSFGLLLALGLGGAVLARRKRVCA